MYRVEIATRADADTVSGLRRAALSASHGFSLHDMRKVDWCETDEVSIVLVVRDEDTSDLVSSMRMTVFADAKAAEQFLEYRVTQHAIEGTVLVMSRAVTSPTRLNLGFMGALRYAYLEGVLRSRIESVVAIVFQGAPRIQSIQRAGFELLDCSENWDSEARVTARPLISVLRRRRFDRALTHTRQEFSETIESCHFDWSAIHERFASVPVL